MIADHELLLAAKAAGATPYLGCDDCSGPGLKIHNGKVLHYEGHGEFGYEWAPRDDDGDALRLAADLGICLVYLYRVAPAEPTKRGVSARHFEIDCEEWGDIYAATRRAIFRAAVEIGKAMP